MLLTGVTPPRRSRVRAGCGCGGCCEQATAALLLLITESKIRWWGLCHVCESSINSLPYPFGSNMSYPTHLQSGEEARTGLAQTLERRFLFSHTLPINGLCV